MSDERKWVHPRTAKVLEKVADYHKAFKEKKNDTYMRVVVGELLMQIIVWAGEGKPILTPRARAVLEAVEVAIKMCDECPTNIRTFCYMNDDIRGDKPCYDLADAVIDIRKAWEDNK